LAQMAGINIGGGGMAKEEFLEILETKLMEFK
jgi:hypothetical protein